MNNKIKKGDIVKNYEILDVCRKKYTYFITKCIFCNKIRRITYSNFINRENICECQKLEQEKKEKKIEKNKLSKIYHAMVHRCYNPKNKQYKNYGGRGIKICDEWLLDKQKFIKWSLENGYKIGASLDRIDNDGNYSYTNCRWTNSYVQNKNRTRVHHIEYNGKIYTLKEFCELKNKNYMYVTSKIKKVGLNEIFKEELKDNFIIRNDNN